MTVFSVGFEEKPESQAFKKYLAEDLKTGAKFLITIPINTITNPAHRSLFKGAIRKWRRNHEET